MKSQLTCVPLETANFPFSQANLRKHKVFIDKSAFSNFALCYYSINNIERNSTMGPQVTLQQLLLSRSENENTKNSTECRKNVFKKWTNERNFQAILEEYKSDVLNQTLSQFYAFRNSVILHSVLLISNRKWILSKFRIIIIILLLCHFPI